MTALYCQRDPGSPPFSSPARCILAQRPQLVKSSRSPSATRNLSSPPLPPPASSLRSPTTPRQANGFFSTPFEKDSRELNSAPSTCLRGAARAVRHPGNGQTSAILFSNSTVVLTPAKNHASSQSIRVHLPSKQQKSSRGFSAKLSHQFKVGCHLEPFTTRQDSDGCRGTGEQSRLPFLHRGSGGWALCSAHSLL